MTGHKNTLLDVMAAKFLIAVTVSLNVHVYKYFFERVGWVRVNFPLAPAAERCWAPALRAALRGSVCARSRPGPLLL